VPSIDRIETISAYPPAGVIRQTAPGASVNPVATFTALTAKVRESGLLRRAQWFYLLMGGILLIVLGLNLMGVIRVSALMRTWRPLQREPSLGRTGRTGIVGGLALGVVFALGWTPCIGPTLGAILTMAAVSSGPQVAALLLAYCIGLGVPFVVLALAADRTPAITRGLARHGRTIELIGGGLVVVLGVAILFDWLALFSNAFVSLWPQV
jgi:cytochrome c-type biogenesis protein